MGHEKQTKHAIEDEFPSSGFTDDINDEYAFRAIYDYFRYISDGFRKR